MSEGLFSTPDNWRRLWRYIRLYGWRRALVKAAGRGQRRLRWALGAARKKEQTISFVGCGQAAFSTLCFFLHRAKGLVFLDAFDTDPAKAERMASFYRFKGVAASAGQLLSNPALKTVYIASNHASHAGYAIAALQKGIDVFVEKPVCTSWTQLAALQSAAGKSSARIWAGYNRPFSAAIEILRTKLGSAGAPLSMVCYVHGHVIPPGHWYRAEDEGTRICGNLGHWLDLAVHLLAHIHRALPTHIEVQCMAAAPQELDDNLTVTLRTDRCDIITIHLSSRSEPFDGIRETIELQCGDLSAQIDDFRKLHIWKGADRVRYRFQPKDVGHKKCTAQPFLRHSESRDWAEVMCGTRLMLHIADMIRAGQREATIDLIAPLPAFSASFGAE